MSSQNVEVKLLNKLLSIKCAPEMVGDLQDSAVFLNEKLEEAINNKECTDTNTIILLTALNISFELLTLKRHHTLESGQLNVTLDKINTYVHEILEETQ